MLVYVETRMPDTYINNNPDKKDPKKQNEKKEEKEEKVENTPYNLET